MTPSQATVRNHVLSVAAGGLIALVAMPQAVARLNEQDEFNHWAVQWDSRDALFRQARADGRLEVQVTAEDDFFMGGLRTDTASWKNNCLANYYGLRSVSVTAVPSPHPRR
jgi:hypothetical protein